ncbi:signal recognition particle subunit Srp14p [[Candida] anglica]|uniref:Signal recognition particle subunit SRP14 n=1 Tax=[Candida] anglica TaxID=148631 RepID=A0ABP0EMK1_9ASCO
MGRLNNTEFLSQLTGILGDNNGKSSVYLTQKRLTPALDLDEGSSATGINDLPSNVINNEDNHAINTDKYPILVRVSTSGAGKKSSNKPKNKISTVVEIDTLDQFWTDYLNVIKNGFVGLKKKEKKKSKKGKVSK